MGEQYFEFRPAAEYQKTGADFGAAAHAHNLTLKVRLSTAGIAKRAVLCMILSRLRPQCRLPRPCS
jgi:hypothetical protein